MKVSCGERGYVPRVPWLLVLVILASQWRPGVSQELEDTGQSCEEEEKSFDSEVRVATLQFEELQIVLLVVAFILLVVIAKLGESGRETPEVMSIIFQAILHNVILYLESLGRLQASLN